MSDTVSENRGVKLAKSLGIYALGNLSSKLIMFMLVPIYSLYIAPEEMGTYDLCFITVLFLLPFFSFQLRDGAFRFLIEADTRADRSKIITFSLKLVARNIIVSLIAATAIALFANPQNMWWILLFTISFALFEIFLQFVRGLGHTQTFVSLGILSSVLICTISLICVIGLDMGINGIFIGNISARLIVVLIAELKIHIASKFFRASVNTAGIAKEIIRFSLPLIVATTLLSIISSSNRYFIEQYIGIHENGLFAVAQKFAAVLETLAFIFYQAWQEMAFKNSKAADRNAFYSKVLNSYIWVLSLLVIMLSFGVRIVYPIIVGQQYQESSNYLFLLMASTMVYAICFFYDIGYQSIKKTSREIPGLAFAAVIALLGNFIFIPAIGVYGVMLSLIVSYVALLTYRIIDIRKYFSLSFAKSNLALFAILTLAGITFHMQLGTIADIITLIVAVSALTIFLPGDVKDMVLSKIKPLIHK